MSVRFRNNVIAALIVFAFWCISFAAMANDPIVTESTSTVTTNGNQTTKVESPPPSAIASQITSSSTDFLCSVSASGAVQTQIFGLSLGGMHEDELCQTLQLSHALYNMGMKVAAISVLCENPIVFRSMANAGTFCPIDGLIQDEAKAAWAVRTNEIPVEKEKYEASVAEKRDKALSIMGSVAAALSSFSYTFGYTSNAALYGHTWSMDSATLGVSAEQGLDISGVIFTYTPVKNVVDDFTVTIEADKVGGGYVFQETDDWSGKYGMKIQKVIPLSYTPVEQFGQSRIKQTGNGSVENASVVYMYRWDACRVPTDPSCPNYVPPLPVIPKIEIYDALEDDAVQEATEETDSDLYKTEEEETKQEEKDEGDDDRLEMAMAATENALTIANTVSQSALLQAMNTATNINSYYAAKIPSTIYKDKHDLSGGDIPDNRLIFRSLSQDNLMNEMIKEQYK